MFNRRMSRSLTLIGISILALGLGLAAQEPKTLPKLDGVPVTPVFNSGRFQARISGPQGLGVLANDVSVFGKGDQAMGFAAKSDEAKTFLIGSFYSEALAYVRGGKTDLAVERIKAMEREFIAMGAPNAVNAVLSRVENLIATKKYEPAVLLDFLGLAQPVCEDYLLSKGKDRLTLFQAGSWLMDMGLAAAAKDKSLLRQPDVLNFFIAEMKRMDAPKGVQDSLAEISAISVKKDIVDRDADQVLKLIKRIQSVLG
jgi:hypothetical protein